MKKELLTIDGIVNLLLGVLLLWYPTSLAADFGLPADGRPFFASVLGAVLFGIGLALLIEGYRPPLRIVGLGLGGAVSINLCAGVVLAALLAVGEHELTLLGQLALGGLVVFLVGLSSVEVYIHVRGAREDRTA